MIAFIDHLYSGQSGLYSRGDLISKKIKEINPEIMTVIVSADRSIESCNLWQQSLVDKIIQKPASNDKLRFLVEVEMEKYKYLNDRIPKNSDINKKLKMIGSSPEFQEMGNLILKFSKSSDEVLLVGETGTGKELIARAIHENSVRKDFPYIIIDCSAYKDQANLLSSELFGHAKGSFTGADRDKIGAFTEASGGTVFLDEFHQLGRDGQAKILRVLEDKVVTRLGDTKGKAIDFRLICGAKPEILEMVEKESFMSDLYYRVSVLSLDIPPLRERADDLIELCEHFQNLLTEKTGKIKTIAPPVMKLFKNYPWPGNIRELKNVLTHLYVTQDDTVLRLRHLKENYKNYKRSPEIFNTMTMEELDSFFLNQQKLLILKTLKETSHNVSTAAKRLGMNRNSLNTRLRNLGIMSLEKSDKEGLLENLIKTLGIINFRN